MSSKEYQKIWRDANKEKIREYAKKYYADNLEQFKIKRKNYYNNNRDQFISKAVQWGKANKEKRRLTCHKFRINNKDKCHQSTVNWRKRNQKKYKEIYTIYNLRDDIKKQRNQMAKFKWPHTYEKNKEKIKQNSRKSGKLARVKLSDSYVIKILKELDWPPPYITKQIIGIKRCQIKTKRILKNKDYENVNINEKCA